jgi:hypothetical protein
MNECQIELEQQGLYMFKVILHTDRSTTIGEGGSEREALTDAITVLKDALNQVETF